MDVLVKAYERENLTQGQRVSIIEKLKQISPEYFNQLSNEKTSIDQLTIAYNAYIASIDRAIIAEIKRARLKTVLERKIQLSVDLNLIEPDTKTDALFNNIPKNAKKAIDAANSIIKKNPFNKNIAVPEIENSVFTDYKSKLAEINRLNKEAFDIEVELAKLEPIKTPDVDKTKKAAETINDVLAKLARQIQLLNQEQLDFGIDKSKEKISAIQSAIEHLSKDFKIDPKNTIIQKLFGDISSIRFIAFADELQKTVANIKLKTSTEVKFDIEQMQKEMDETIGKKKLKTKAQIQYEISNSDMSSPNFVPSSTQYTKAKDYHQKFLNEITQANQNAADTMRKTFDEIFVSIGESIGESIGSGANFAETVFGNLFKVLGAGLKQLGEAMIGIGTAKIVLENSNFRQV